MLEELLPEPLSAAKRFCSLSTLKATSPSFDDLHIAFDFFFSDLSLPVDFRLVPILILSLSQIVSKGRNWIRTVCFELLWSIAHPDWWRLAGHVHVIAGVAPAST